MASTISSILILSLLMSAHVDSDPQLPDRTVDPAPFHSSISYRLFQMLLEVLLWTILIVLLIFFFSVLLALLCPPKPKPKAVRKPSQRSIASHVVVQMPSPKKPKSPVGESSSSSSSSSSDSPPPKTSPATTSFESVSTIESHKPLTRVPLTGSSPSDAKQVATTRSSSSEDMVKAWNTAIDIIKDLEVTGSPPTKSPERVTPSAPPGSPCHVPSIEFEPVEVESKAAKPEPKAAEAASPEKPVTGPAASADPAKASPPASTRSPPVEASEIRVPQAKVTDEPKEQQQDDVLPSDPDDDAPGGKKSDDADKKDEDCSDRCSYIS